MDFRMMESLQSCPYNSTHQILPHRMAKHIIKCKKNYPNAEMKVCIFNAVHVVPTHQYQAHLLECENRELVERELYIRPQTVKKPPLMKAESLPLQDVSTKCEDWESDCVQSSYSPEEAMNSKEFTRAPPPGLSKGARKMWRLTETERVKRLKNGMLVGDSLSHTNTSMSGETTNTVNGGCGVAGAITKVPQLKGKFKSDVSGVEAAMTIPQMSQNSRHPDTETAISSLKKASQNSDWGNPVDKNQEGKNWLDMTDFIKEKRKLEKKLFEIKKLEHMKVNLNEKLTDQEETKILSKKIIEGKLANLMELMNV